MKNKLTKDTAIEPYINEDGYYTQCRKCYTEVYPMQQKCPKCDQLLDWSWLRISLKTRRNKYGN